MDWLKQICSDPHALPGIVVIVAFAACIVFIGWINKRINGGK